MWQRRSPGSVGLAGSANIGTHCAMFEAIHGSAHARRAGLDLANPSGLLLGGVMMMVHIGQPDVAERVHNAWLATIGTAITPTISTKKASDREGRRTREFAQKVVEHLGKKPQHSKRSVTRPPAA